MKADASLTDNILHHLSFWTYDIPQFGPLGIIHLDVLLVSAIVFFCVAVIFYKASLQLHLKPSFYQNFCEYFVDIVRKEIQGTCPHYMHTIGPLALSLFLAILFMNALDILPASLGGQIMSSVGLHHNFRVVPTADLNITLALSVFSFVAIQLKAIYIHGLGNFIKGWLTHPFGAIAFPINILSRFVEEFSRIFSLGMRLFGNIYAGEIIFALLAFSPLWLKLPGVFLWCGFHLLIIYLQAFIFTMLTIVIFSLSVEH
jgi:F-type H+-transporting ATPase subunit a